MLCFTGISIRRNLLLQHPFTTGYIILCELTIERRGKSKNCLSGITQANKTAMGASGYKAPEGGQDIEADSNDSIANFKAKDVSRAVRTSTFQPSASTASWRLRAMEGETTALKEELALLREQLLDKGVIDAEASKELDQDVSSLEKASYWISPFVHIKLSEYFGWKKALCIALPALAMNFTILGFYTWHRVNDCTPFSQVMQASSYKKKYKKSLGQWFYRRNLPTRHLCATEMLSIRSYYYSLKDLQDLDAQENLVNDTRCHLNNFTSHGLANQHALIDRIGSSRPSHPSMHVHDLSYAEWYPCMFQGLTCSDYGPADKCGGSGIDLMIKGCEQGIVDDVTYKSTTPASNDTQNPYRCDLHTFSAENKDKEPFAHFDRCSGVVSVQMVQCPSLFDVLGAAQGLMSLLLLVCSIVVVLVASLTIWRADTEGTRTFTKEKVKEARENMKEMFQNS